MCIADPFDRPGIAHRYDRWFDEHPAAFRSELAALRELMPPAGEFNGIEIGAGTGRFGPNLGIFIGVEPSVEMGTIAGMRGMSIIRGVAEKLPLGSERFDLVLVVTTLCFVGDVGNTFREIHRVLKTGGAAVIGFLDRGSPPGRSYEEKKEKSVFYSHARFLSGKEVRFFLETTGFTGFRFMQTISRGLGKTGTPETPLPGHGKGLFAAVKARKA